jgi:hypothetical protein
MAILQRLTLSTGAALFCACALAGEPPLAPHRAVYELSMTKSSGTNAPSEVRGRIAFDFSGSACDGYVQNFRQITELQPSEGSARVSDMRSATFEAGDGRDFRFKIETRIGGAQTDDVDGKASKLKADTLTINLAKPTHDKVDIAGPVLFPTEHVRRILAAARAGETILEAKVYDGSGNGEKVFDTMSVIGKPAKTPASEKAAQIDALKNRERWPVTISYFEEGKKDQQPVYVLSFDLYDNGISRALKLDYGDFALSGEMTELTLLPTRACDK